jgi:hypothetical protein
MTLLDLKLNPSARELRWFGPLVIAFFALAGALLFAVAGSAPAAWAAWITGCLLGALYYAVPALRLPIYRGWMRAFYPVGWIVSHTLLGVIYYLVLTPIGLTFRLLRRDPLRRHGVSDDSYWQQPESDPRPSRYFNQF